MTYRGRLRKRPNFGTKAEHLQFCVLSGLYPLNEAAKSGAVNSEQASDIGGGSAGSEHVHNYIRQGRIGLGSGWGAK